ncbi:MAG: hypothetical protein V3V05_13130 [Pontiella sp.]
MERDNRKVVTVPLSIFSEADQKYILQWGFNKVFLSESSFKIDAKRKEVKDKDDSYSSTIQAKKVENMGYELVLENRSTAKLENIEIEYCIYYEQERATRGKQLCEQGVRYEKIEIPYLIPKSKKEIMTEAVKIYKAELDADWIYTSGVKNVQKGKVHGIWVQVHMKLDSGEKISRNFSLPDSLNNNKAWKTSSTYVGMNSSRKKNK